MAGYYSSLFGQLTFKFFQTRMADFTLFVGIKKNSFKVIKDGRLHFVCRYQEKFCLQYFWDGRRFAPASFEV